MNVRCPACGAIAVPLGRAQATIRDVIAETAARARLRELEAEIALRTADVLELQSTAEVSSAHARQIFAERWLLTIVELRAQLGATHERLANAEDLAAALVLENAELKGRLPGDVTVDLLPPLPPTPAGQGDCVYEDDDAAKAFRGEPQKDEP